MNHRSRYLATLVAAGAALLLTLDAAAGRGPTIEKGAPIPTCGYRLDPSVDGLIRPVLLGLVKMRQTSGGVSEAAFKLFEDPFYALLRSEDPRALEAQVALTAYYVGEHPGGELIEALLSHGPLADRLVAKYRVCRPLTSFEDRLTGVVVLGTKYRIYDDERRRSRKAG